MDVVLSLEGNSASLFRVLHGSKNRFGPTDEVGVFEMEDKGMVEVKNPSKIFLDQKVDAPGSAVVAILTGIDEELGRLNLSIKLLQDDPFSKLSEQFPADEVIKGEVTASSDEGLSVKLKGDVEGFLPASKMGQASYEMGKFVTLLVEGVDLKRRRVNLAPFVTTTSGLIYK